MSAHAIAGELRLPLFSIRLDSLISKMMGETASKLRLIFEALAETRGVYLFDEVDALAGERSMGNDVGEIRRVLNSFLQFLEQDEGDSVLIAATNHVQLLDRAMFRRFDLVVDYQMPTPHVVRTLVRNRLALVPTGRIAWPAIDEAATGLSHAEITIAAESAAKRALLSGQESVTTSMLVSALEERRLLAHE
jgi:AAA+ superfamily predicted ATPase